MFLGLTNSADEIIRDRAMLQRESATTTSAQRTTSSAKLLTLGFFALLQCVIYLLVGNAILEIREMFFTTSLDVPHRAQRRRHRPPRLQSRARPEDRPQHHPAHPHPPDHPRRRPHQIRGDEPQLDFVYSIRRWLDYGERDDGLPASPAADPSRLKVPTVCEFMPLRWSYEGLVIDQANHNPVSSAQARVNRVIDELKLIEQFTPDERRRFDAAKQALALISGLEAGSAVELQQTLDRILDEVADGSFDPAHFPFGDDPEETLVSGDEIFVNQKVLGLVTKAEMERLDYRDEREQNVFFGTRRTFEFPGSAGRAGGGQDGPGADPDGRESRSVSVPTRALNVARSLRFRRCGARRTLPKPPALADQGFLSGAAAAQTASRPRLFPAGAGCGSAPEGQQEVFGEDGGGLSADRFLVVDPQAKDPDEDRQKTAQSHFWGSSGNIGQVQFCQWICWWRISKEHD